MALKAYNVGGGRHSEAALSALLSQLFGGDVAKGFNIEPTGSAGLSVRVLPGTAQIRVNTLYSRMIQNDANITTTAVAAPTSNPRRNLVVAYIDPSVTPTTSVVDNINGVVKVAVVLGAEAATPQIPTDSAVTAAVGTQNWIPLGDFRTNVSQTSVVAGNITDQRRMILVTSDKIDSATLQRAVEAVGTNGNRDSLATIVSITYPFIAGRQYLITQNYQIAIANGGGAIWGLYIRVDGTQLIQARTSSRGGEAGIQTSVSSSVIYSPTTSANRTVAMVVERLVGDNTINTEFPRLTIIPLMTGTNTTPIA